MSSCRQSRSLQRRHCVLSWQLLLTMLTLVVLLPPGHGTEDSTLKRLEDDLFRNYSITVRPVIDHTTTTHVSLNFELVFIEDLDEKKQRFAAVYWFYFLWKDEHLAWDPGHYDNIERMVLPSSKVWIPDLVISNAIESRMFIGRKELTLAVTNDGTVQWYVDERAVTMCNIDVTRFPLDSQDCQVKLWQWSSVIKELNVTATNIRTSVEEVKENGKWKLENVSTEIIEYTSIQQKLIIFNMRLVRRRIYYVIAAILPVCLLSVLNLFVFYIPLECGERLSLCLSLLVSYSVYISGLQATLPEVSDNVCIFSVYVTAMFVLKITTTLTCIFLSHVMYNAHLWPTLVQFASRYLAKGNRRKLHCDKPDIRHEFLGAATRSHARHDDNQNDPNIKAAILGLDRLFFYVYITIYIIGTLATFVIMNI